MSTRQNVALVAGANGSVGRAFVDELARLPDWSLRVPSRRPVEGLSTLKTDLLDASATREAIPPRAKP